MKYHIGDRVIDEDGNSGIIVICWNDGDICEYENDAAHPNPKLLHGIREKDESQELDSCYKQPSPTPTRQEWAEWASRVADSVWGDAPVAFERLVDALLSMPIVPKE